MLRLDSGFCIAVEICASYLTERGKKLRWKLYPKRFEKDYVTLLCLLNRENTEIREFFMFNRLGRSRGCTIKEADAWLATAKGLDVSQIYQTAKSFQPSISARTNLRHLPPRECTQQHTRQLSEAAQPEQMLRSLTTAVVAGSRRQHRQATPS